MSVVSGYRSYLSASRDSKKMRETGDNAAIPMETTFSVTLIYCVCFLDSYHRALLFSVTREEESPRLGIKGRTVTFYREPSGLRCLRILVTLPHRP